jgi:predicted transcriptional regulator
MVMNQLISFYKPNKKVRSEKIIIYLISQIKYVVGERKVR